MQRNRRKKCDFIAALSQWHRIYLRKTQRLYFKFIQIFSAFTIDTNKHRRRERDTHKVREKERGRKDIQGKRERETAQTARD